MSDDNDNDVDAHALRLAEWLVDDAAHLVWPFDRDALKDHLALALAWFEVSYGYPPAGETFRRSQIDHLIGKTRHGSWRTSVCRCAGCQVKE